MSFLNVVFTMELAVANTTLSTTPIGDVPAPITLAATTVYYNPAMQISPTTGGTPIPTPPPDANGAQIIYIKNLDNANLIVLTYSPQPSGPATHIVIPPGGIFLYFNPQVPPPGGIDTMSAQADTSTVSAEVFIGY